MCAWNGSAQGKTMGVTRRNEGRLLLALAALLIGAGPVAAQKAVRVIEESVQRVSGEVIRVRGNLLTLRKDDGGREVFHITPGVNVSVEGQQVALQALKPGQKIRVYVTLTEKGWVIVSPPREAKPEATDPPATAD
jgi:hypothetical protein